LVLLLRPVIVTFWAVAMNDSNRKAKVVMIRFMPWKRKIAKIIVV